MKKLVLSLAIASALGLSGCESETLQDVQEETVNGGLVTPTARVIYDPADGVLSVPNDILFTDTTDGTLNIPVDDPTNFADPTVAINALDGWSTMNPFVIELDFPETISLDASSVASPASVRVFEVEFGGPTATTEACAALPSGIACQVVSELTFGVDFVAQAVGNNVGVVPVNPFKGKTSYIVVLTNNIKDSNGKAVAGSTTYELVRQDINTLPLGSESQLALQAAINSYEGAVVSSGVDSDSIIYTMAMTTQSTVDVLGTLKAQMAQGLQLGQVPAISVVDTTLSVDQALAASGLELSPEQAASFSTANYLSGSITLPYYLGVPSAENPLAPVNDWWKAQCDSAVTLAGLAAANPAAIPSEAVDDSDAACIAISQAAGLPAPGLRDLSAVATVDAERHLTKFNPVPKSNGNMTLDVQMTTPDVAVANAVRGAQGLPDIAEPENGWPVVIMQHGITTNKEAMLLLTGTLSMNGFATIAIDHPLHGSRGFDIDPTQEGDEINATTVSATHYMNLASLLTTRDNLRQSVSDMLGLRLGVNFISGSHADSSPVSVDPSKVYFVGHSLGAITGINFVAMANAPLDEAVDPLFRVSANTQAMPGVGVANLLLESPAFSGLIKASLVSSSVPEFAASLPEDATEAELVAAYQLFFDSLDATAQAELNAIFSGFAFAAQTVTDSGDPVNYAGTLAATMTPTHLIEVVGNGAENLSDQVIPNVVSSSPLSGTEAAIRLLGLSSVSETTEGSGAVRFIYGHHGSVIDPTSRDESPDAALSAASTIEMQTQIATFFATGSIPVVNADVVQ